MNLMVTGSRDYPKLELVAEILGRFPADTVLIHGGARGVDTAADEAAKDLFVAEPRVFPAQWRTKKGNYDKGAGLKRNVEMLKQADQVLGFWDEASKGTRHAIDQAMKRQIPIAVFGINGDLLFVAEES